LNPGVIRARLEGRETRLDLAEGRCIDRARLWDEMIAHGFAILDHVMPAMDGITRLKPLQDDSRGPPLKLSLLRFWWVWWL
jgi:hypothetical protein